MMMVFTIITPVFGSEVPLISASNNSPYKENFKNKWHHTIEKNGGRHYLYYAYDMSLVKEDVAYADSKGYRHRSKIVNARGTFYGPKKWANQGRSDQEVRHKGATVKYYCNVFK